MYPRTNYEMSEENLKELLEACRPTPCILVGGFAQLSQQDMANAAWQRLGGKMGFDYLTVRPIAGKGNSFFSAVPSETETQRSERLKKEAEEKNAAEIKTLEGEIQERQERLKLLEQERLEI